MEVQEGPVIMDAKPLATWKHADRPIPTWWASYLARLHPDGETASQVLSAAGFANCTARNSPDLEPVLGWWESDTEFALVTRNKSVHHISRFPKLVGDKNFQMSSYVKPSLPAPPLPIKGDQYSLL